MTRTLSCLAATSLLLLSSMVLGTTVDHTIRVDLGELHPGLPVQVDVEWRNDRDDMRRFLEQRASGAHDMRVSDLPRSVPPGAGTVFSISGIVPRFTGTRSYPIELVDSEGAVLTILLQGLNRTLFEPAGEVVELGVAVIGDERPRRIVSFRSEEVDHFELRLLQDEAEAVEVTVLNDGRSFELTPREALGWGTYIGWLQFETGSDRQPHLWVRYEFEARGKVVPSVYVQNAGLRRGEDDPPLSFLLQDYSGKRLRIGDVQVSGTPARVAVQPCPIESRDCRMLVVDDFRFTQPGQFSTEISVALPRYRQRLPLVVNGVYLPDAAVRTGLTEEMAEAAQRDDRQVDLSAALEQARLAANPITLAPPDGEGPVLRWRVVNDRRFYGYVVFRAIDTDGDLQYERVSYPLVRGIHADAGRPVEYAWRDVAAQPDTSYVYRVVALRRDASQQEIVPPTPYRYSIDD